MSKYGKFKKDVNEPKDLEKCWWCYAACSNCGYSYFDEHENLRCNKFPDSEYHRGLCEIDCKCRHWICYKEKREEE